MKKLILLCVFLYFSSAVFAQNSLHGRSSLTKKQIGSYTAKAGFSNELDIQKKFQNWQVDKDVSLWLRLMGYPIKLISDLEVEHIPSHLSKSKLLVFGATEETIKTDRTFKKADLQVRVVLKGDDRVYIENVSLKRSKTTSGFNHVGKRPVNTYHDFWGFPDDVKLGLKYFTGKIKPEEIAGIELASLKDKKHRRLYFPEMEDVLRVKIMQFFEQNKMLVVSDLIRGRGVLRTDWLLVTEINAKTETRRWVLADINDAINFYAEGDVRQSPRGSLYIGKVFMQRKGGTPDPTSLQFKINPLQLFDD